MARSISYWLLGLVVAGGLVASLVYFRRPTEEPQPQHKDDVKDFVMGEVLQVPYIFWGGDVPTYLANGGETTQPGSPFHKQGLNVKLVRCDDFARQVADYKEGKSPFLRGTMSMLGQAAEDVAADDRSK